MGAAGRGALISVTANALHAVVAADADVPGVLAACVAAVPPLVLLASTHLTVVLVRSRPSEPTQQVAPEPAVDIPPRFTAEPEPEPAGRRLVAARLRAEGWSNKAIARHLQVAPSTVGRWFAARGDAPDEQESPKELTA